MFCLDADLLEHDAFGMRGAAEGRRLERGAEQSFLVVQIGPAAFAAGVLELAGGVEAAGLAFGHFPFG